MKVNYFQLPSTTKVASVELIVGGQVLKEGEPSRVRGNR
jgi:hypothetical protein